MEDSISSQQDFPWMGSRSPCAATGWFHTAHQQGNATQSGGGKQACNQSVMQAEGSCDPAPVVERRSNSLLHGGNHMCWLFKHTA